MATEPRRETAPAPQRVRSFVALDIEARVLDAVRALQQDLARSRADVRWVRAEGMHVTLKFLGLVDAARLEWVQERVHTVVRDHAPLALRVRGLGAFPSLRRPRVLWVGVEGEGLTGLARGIEAAVESLGFESEQRAFSPHLTLGRVNSLRGWPALEDRLKAHWEDDFGVSVAGAVIIYRSTLSPDGAVYTPLWTFALQNSK